MTRSNEVVDFDGIDDRIVHYCLDNGIPYESSVPLDQFKDAQGNLDDVKLIKAFNDAKTPLVFTPKAPIPPDAVTASARASIRTSVPRTPRYKPRASPRRAASPRSSKTLDRAVHRPTRLGFSRRAARQRADAERRA